MTFLAPHIWSQNPFIVQWTQLVPTHILFSFSLPPKRKPQGKMMPPTLLDVVPGTVAAILLQENNNMSSNVSITQLQQLLPIPTPAPTLGYFEANSNHPIISYMYF